VSRDAHLVMKVSTKFEVDTTICCLVIALYDMMDYINVRPKADVVDGENWEVDSRDKARRTERSDRLCVRRMMLVDERG